MRSGVALLFLLTAVGCGWEMTLGRGSGVAPFRFEETVPNPARAEQDEMEVTRDVELFSAEASARMLDNLGPDRIGSLRGVTLTVTEMRIDGLDLDRTGPPALGILGHPLTGEIGASIQLDDFQVNELRDRLLSGEAMTGMLSLFVELPMGTLDDRFPSLHIVLVLQPTLVVDAL